MKQPYIFHFSYLESMGGSQTNNDMNLGYWFFIIGFVIALVSGFLYGFGEIFWGIVVGAVLLGVVLLTRKKR